MKPRRTLSVTLAAILLFSTLGFRECSKSDRAELLGHAAEVVASAQDVVEAMKAAFPEGDPRLEKVSVWLARAEEFRAAVAAGGDATTTLGLLEAVVTGFRVAVLPYTDAHPNVRLVVALADAALKSLVRRFKKQVTAAAKSRPDVARSPRAQSAIRVMDDYLATPPVERVK